MCLEGRAGCETCCWLQHFLSYDTENMGTGVPKRLLRRNFSLHFAPDVFQGKALSRVQGKHGEGGSSEVCISYISFTRVQETWAGAMLVAWWVRCPHVWLLPALGSAPCLSGQTWAEWRGIPGSFGWPIWML